MDGIFLALYTNQMAVTPKFEVVIIGGGLAGLTTALHLSENGCQVCLIEKYPYPHHKVCGEYVSNEVLPYLNLMGIDPFKLGAKKISKFQITDTTGNPIKASLPLGGFGISRYAFDNLLYETLINKAQVIFDTVEKVIFEADSFKITTQQKTSFRADYVVGAFGKRSNLDSFLKRKFMDKPSPWLAVKAHYKYEFPDDTVALHNFEGGYCGLSKTETNAVNACYLTTFKSFKKFGDIQVFQQKVLSKNPFLKTFFKEAEPLFPKPLTIGQVSFDEKNPVENHIFMVGDSAGLIHPLCGNGMAMGIHGAKIFSELFLESIQNKLQHRLQLEAAYTELWHRTFSKRLKTGKLVQNILMNPIAEKIGFSIAKHVPSLLPTLIKKTHGNQFL